MTVSSQALGTDPSGAAMHGDDPAEAHGSGPAGRYSVLDVARAEWIKLVTVRSTTWSIVALVVVSTGIGSLVAMAKASQFSRHPYATGIGFDPTRLSLSGLLLGQFAIGVLGALFVTAEYSTGTIYSTLAAVPRRHLVVIAKTVVFGLVAFAASEVTCFASFYAGQAILSGSAPYATLSSPGALRAVISGGLYLTALGLLALGIGCIVRHTAAAISIFVTILLVFPLILQALPTSYINAVGKFLPANIGLVLLSGSTPASSILMEHMFSPWVGFGILCSYAVVALVAGTLSMIFRDA
ncbi:MAG: ABC transporter permease [Actinobacteria bacterium]|jgi:hypothetical protein|nr:ABC transporter permease [Actinomycetota bacterium]